MNRARVIGAIGEIILERTSASRYCSQQFFASLISGSVREIPFESGAVALL
jgi:hypothetical protein